MLIDKIIVIHVDNNVLSENDQAQGCELTEKSSLKLNQKISIKNLVIDVMLHKVTANGVEVHLTNLEYKILLLLASTPERVYTYQQIYELIWEEPYAYEKGNIMTHISHLKSKIEPDSTNPQYIENIRGVGYRFIKE